MSLQTDWDTEQLVARRNSGAYWVLEYFRCLTRIIFTALWTPYGFVQCSYLQWESRSSSPGLHYTLLCPITLTMFPLCLLENNNVFPLHLRTGHALFVIKMTLLWFSFVFPSAGRSEAEGSIDILLRHCHLAFSHPLKTVSLNCRWLLKRFV